jgi:hypothetical protein
MTIIDTHEDPARNRGVTADLTAGLRWLRESSDEDDVLAVNNHLVDPESRGRSVHVLLRTRRAPGLSRELVRNA